MVRKVGMANKGLMEETDLSRSVGLGTWMENWSVAACRRMGMHKA